MLPKIETILYATDLGRNASSAFRMAYKLAEVNTARIVLLHVIERVSAQVANLVESYLPEGTFDELQREGKQRAFDSISQRLADFCGEELQGALFPENRIEQRVQEGHAAQTILDVAEEIDADLLVLGAHAHTAMGDLVLGSVANKVMHRTRRPLLLVPIRD